jgi:hypothetical protein
LRPGLADQRPGAYERVVDRLLTSPHHGERLARHWLDAARYADSNGYSIDAAQSIWKCPDWDNSQCSRISPWGGLFELRGVGESLLDENPLQVSLGDDGKMGHGRGLLPFPSHPLIPFSLPHTDDAGIEWRTPRANLPCSGRNSLVRTRRHFTTEQPP